MSAWYWPENHRCCLLNLIMISFLQGRRRKSQLRGGNKRHVIWNGKYWNELGIVYTVCLCVHVQSMYMCYRIRSALIYWCRHSHITTRKMQVIISSYPFIQFLFDRARGCIRLQLGQLSIDVQLPFESHLGIIRTAEDQKTITWWVADDGDALAVSEFLRDVWYLVMQWCLAIFRTLKMANLWHTMGIHGMDRSNSWATKLAPRFFALFLGRKRAIFSKGLWAALERLWMAMLHYEVMTTPLGIARMYQLWHSLSIFSLESGVSHRLRIADVHSEMPAACTHCISEQTYLQQSWWIWPCQIKKGWQAYSSIYIYYKRPKMITQCHSAYAKGSAKAY